MGYLIAVANALVVSGLDVLVKKLKGGNNLFLIWLRTAAALPALALLVTIFASWHIPPWQFWALVLGVNLPIEIAAYYLGFTAIQRSPLSLVAPLHAVSGIFLILTGYLVLGEQPSAFGAVGIMLIVLGSFFLGWRPGEESFFRGLTNVFREPGSYLIIGVALLTSVSIVISKFAFRYASPLLTAFYIIGAIAVVLLPAAMRGMGSIQLPNRNRFLAALGAGAGASFALHYTGLSLLPAAYFISVKRVSMVFNVFWGRFVFHEDHTRERLIGALLMVAGVILIAIS